MFLESADAGPWIWVERASWITVSVSLVLGLLAVAYQVRQLRFEQQSWSESQERLAAELAKAPRITFGYLPDETVEKPADALVKETSLTATWPEDSDLSDPISVRVYICNTGERAAKDADIECRFNRGVVRAMTEEIQDGISGLARDGSPRWFLKGHTINPTMFYRRVMKVRVPRSMPQITVKLALVMDNYPPVKDELTIRVEYRGTTRLAPLTPKGSLPPHS